MCSCRWDIVLALRDGRLASINLGAIDGIISFASLHAAAAVIVPFTLRWNKQLFWPIVVLDGVLLRRTETGRSQEGSLREKGETSRCRDEGGSEHHDYRQQAG
jgi:hypothetical protein